MARDVTGTREIPEWVEHLVIEEGQSLLFKVSPDATDYEIDVLVNTLDTLLDFPFVVVRGEFEVTVIEPT